MRQTSMAAIAEVLRVLVIGDGRFAFLPYLGEAATASALTLGRHCEKNKTPRLDYENDQNGVAKKVALLS